MLRILFLISFLFTCYSGFSQIKQPVGAVAFYNVENLFDTEDDPAIWDEEFTPEGNLKWTQDLYIEKLTNMSTVIANIVNNGPDIIGLAEIENRKVLEDLVSAPALKDKGYQIIQFNSPDGRGIDVALLYKAGKYIPFSVNTIAISDPAEPGFKTRDILWVKGLYQKDTLHVAVNHWPSRRGGKEDKRLLAAQVLRNAVDSVQRINPDSKIIIMGDLNDDPINKSVRKVLRADHKDLKPGDLYNPSMDIFKKGYGTLYYRGAWNLFDQIIISQSLLPKNNGLTYIDETFTVYGPEALLQKDGPYKGAPFRTFVSGMYKGGFSDHLPVFILLGK